MYAHRLADRQTLQQYPFPVAGPADWQSAQASPVQDGCVLDGCLQDGWMAVIAMPDLPAGQIIVPSLSVLDDTPYGFQFCLCVGDQRYPLAPVPGREPIANPSDSRVQTAIDCFHSQQPLARVRMEFSFRGRRAPQRYLLSVTTRPTLLEGEIRGLEAAISAPPLHTRLPPAYSQMLENPRHAGGVCSPVSTAMVLAHHGRRPLREHFIATCHDRITRAYGLWPLAIHAASRQGCIGAVELLDNWEQVIACLTRDLPVVASIRFSSGGLPGSPMPATAGHLLVVHGIEDAKVLVNDPAAPHHGAVTRRYPLVAFGEAWFRHRGAAYILLP